MSDGKPESDVNLAAEPLDAEAEEALREATGAVDDDLEGSTALDDVDVRDLLRGALRPPPGAVAPELLGGVQRTLRVRSRGKFYGDGWSTVQAPRSTYLVTSALMLVLILVVAILLIPWEAVGL